MDHFVIYDSEHPQPEPVSSHYSYDPGNYRYTGLGNIRVLAFLDEGESVDVQVAIERRVAIAELPDDVPFVIFNGQGAFAL